ncbi:MAG: ABC transporter ATP-binding protein [Deltaproteobacteria bacterium]|nr:ABC transporter ATP-binding protein [Deltaproteobacteria bacterium]
MLKIKEIDVFYGPIKAIDKVSLYLDHGETVAIIGANGAGKTTLLKAISGLLKPRSGEIMFQGKNIKNLRADEIVKMGIVMVPEGRKVFPHLTVQENLDLGAYLISEKKLKARLMDLVLSTFPRLKERLKQMAGTLSGGEQQMLAMGRALMSAPRLLLLDEPSMGLSPIVTREIFGLIAKIKKENEISIILVEQNAHMALEVSQRAYVLENGRLFLEGMSKDMKNHPKIIEAYLGV